MSHTDWLERVPDLVAHCREVWGLRLGEPYLAGAAGYTVRADLQDGTAAVLKLVYPHREAEHEADALADWDGNGAVRLLARDDGQGRQDTRTYPIGRTRSGRSTSTEAGGGPDPCDHHPTAHYGTSLVMRWKWPERTDASALNAISS